MAYNEELTNRVRAALENVRRVEEKKMFSGITFMVNGKMCVSVGDDRIMCRIDPAIHETMIEKPGCLPMKMNGREYKGYVYVDEDVIKTRKELGYWIKLALDFNKAAKASRKRKNQRDST